MWNPDPRLSWKLRLVAIVAASLLLGTAGVGWVLSWSPPAPVQVAGTVLDTQVRTVVALDPDAWSRVAWDAPIAPVAKAPAKSAREVRLVALMNRQGTDVAGLEPQGGRLVFLSPGETSQGIKLIAIEAQAAQVEVDGEPRKLKLQR